MRLFLSLDRRADSVLLLGYVRATLVGVPVLLFVVALGAWLIARTGLQPLRRFHHLAASIGTQSLGQRVSAVGLPGELAGLAEEFNGMPDRIHLGYQRLQEFSGDLAHEMRTPIATLLGRTQVALSHRRTVEDLQGVLEGNVDELERVSRHVVDYLSLVAEERGIAVELTGAATVLADRLLLERAIINVAFNAIRSGLLASGLLKMAQQ